MRSLSTTLLLTSLVMVASLVGPAAADPCGMVPPITVSDPVPITRVGDQQTYVFFKDGTETFVIRPGFEGKADEFGMLIPFPTPPAIRKVPEKNGTVVTTNSINETVKQRYRIIARKLRGFFVVWITLCYKTCPVNVKLLSTLR